MSLVSLSLLALFAPIGRSSAVCSLPDGTCTEPQQHEGGTAGLGLLQSRAQRDKAVVGSEGEAGGGTEANNSWCRQEGEDPFLWPCCHGLTRCGPYTSLGNSFRCQRSCTQADDCGCTPGQNGWSSRAQRCSPTSETSPEEAAACRNRMPTPAQTPSAPSSGSGKLKLMSWNVYFGNGDFDAMAHMLRAYDVDIANLQETNNRLDSIAQASGYTSANSWRQVHDWCGYNFHRSDWSHEWSKEVEVPGSRGVCGAMLQRGATKLCVWGLHPVQNKNNVKFSQESIRLAADEMKKCSSQFNAPSIFMGDFNTMDWRGAQWQLEQSTGWGWTLAAKNHIDFIFIQASPLSVGYATYSKVVGHGCVPGFPGHNERDASCGWSDHNPVYAEIQLQ